MNTDDQAQTLNQALLTGVAQIDEQHQILINMLADAKQHLSESTHRPNRLPDLIRDLMSYALYHFESEEALMQDSHFDAEKQVLHVQEHRAFAAKIAQLQHALSHGEPVSPEELLRFLSAWLDDHIQNTDKQLGQFLTSTKPSS